MWKRKIKVIFYLKSGNKISFRCKDIKITHTNKGEITSYSLINADLEITTDLENIEAITFKQS